MFAETKPIRWCEMFVCEKHLIRLHKCADTFSHWRRLIVTHILEVATGIMRGVSFQTTNGRPYMVGTRCPLHRIIKNPSCINKITKTTFQSGYFVL